MNKNPYYNPYWFESDSLEHHGILGMRWGIRRYQNKDGTLTAAGKKRYLIKIKPAVVKGQRYDKDIIIPAGTIGYRAQGSDKLKSDSPLIYLSYDKKDHLDYLDAAVFSPDSGVARDAWGADPLPNVYSVELKTKKALKAPSYQNAMEIFVDMVGDIGIDKINPYDTKYESGQKFIDSWNTRAVNELGADYSYKYFVNEMSRPDRSTFYKEFAKRLADKGYNTLVDPIDRPYSKKEAGMSAPFIIMNPKQNLEVVKSTKLSKSDINYFENRDYDKSLKKSPEHKKWAKWSKT